MKLGAVAVKLGAVRFTQPAFWGMKADSAEGIISMATWYWNAKSLEDWLCPWSTAGALMARKTAETELLHTTTLPAAGLV